MDGMGVIVAALLGRSSDRPEHLLVPQPPGSHCRTCPRNLMLVSDDVALADRITLFDTWFVVGIAFAVVWVLAYRWWHATKAGRRIFGLRFGSASRLRPSSSLSRSTEWLSPIAILLGRSGAHRRLSRRVPVGALRTRMSRSAVGDLVIELGRGSMPVGGLRDALAKRLGDPSLQLAYVVDEAGGWVDESGHPIELPPGSRPDGDDTGVRRGAGRRTDPRRSAQARARAGRSGGLGRTVPAVTNERLQARVRASSSWSERHGIAFVEAADEERRRLERDLHDGAQQRLVWLSLLLGLADEEVATGDGVEGRRLLDEARAEAEGALIELRSLARGIHPAILTNAGLGPAIRSLVNRSQIPVRVDALTDRRFPPNIEATAYFVIAETLTNAAKHSHGSRATVSIMARDGHLVVDIADDGVGGAESARLGPTWIDRQGRRGRRFDRDREPAAKRDARAFGTSVRVALADDAVLFREGIARVLSERGFEVVAQFGNADDLLGRSRRRT